MASFLLGRICRTCLLESPAMHKLLDMKGELQIEVMLKQTIPHFDDEDLDVDLPVEICGDCLDKLSVSYSFQIMVLANYKRLRSLIKHQEVEDVVLVPKVRTNDKDQLKDDDNKMYDYEESDSLKSEPDELSYEVQNALDKLEEEAIKEADLLATVQEDDEIKIEIEPVEEKPSSYEVIDNFEEDIHGDTDNDEDYWPTKDDDAGSEESKR